MPEASPPPSADSLTLRWIDDDAEYRSLAADALESIPDVDLVLEDTPEAALDALDDADCVVSALDLPTRDGLSVLAAIRERHPRLPFVLHTTTALEDVDESLLETDHTDYVRKDWDESTIRLLVRRARTLAERNRFHDAAGRLATAVDTCRHPVVVAGSDDAIEYANGQFASAVAPARTDLRGRQWTEVFTEDSVEQLQHEAITVGTDGWRWSGTTVLAAGPGQEVRARTTLVQLDDGSKVFAFRDLDQPT